MLQVKHIKESRFEVNRREGRLFHDSQTPMSSDEQKEFIRNNFVIGYQGKDVRLTTWANKHSKGLTVRNLPGENIEEKRQILWQAVRENNLDRWLVELTNRIKQGNIVTIYYLSSHDKPVAELLQRFVTWFAQQ